MSRRSECRIQISSGFFLLAAWFGVVNGWRLLAVVLGWGLPGIWVAAILDEAFKATAYLLHWKSGKWQSARV